MHLSVDIYQPFAGLTSDSEIDGEEEMLVDGDSEWFPHGSKTVIIRYLIDDQFCRADYKSQMFMLDLLDNLPRLRLSDDHLKAIIWVMKECGTPSVPSFYALRQMQAKLAREANVKPEQNNSPLGNIFFMNNPATLLSLASKPTQLENWY